MQATGHRGITAVLRSRDLTPTGGGQGGTSSEPDKVRVAVVPASAKFADLSVEGEVRAGEDDMQVEMDKNVSTGKAPIMEGNSP